MFLTGVWLQDLGSDMLIDKHIFWSLVPYREFKWANNLYLLETLVGNMEDGGCSSLYFSVMIIVKIWLLSYDKTNFQLFVKCSWLEFGFRILAQICSLINTCFEFWSLIWNLNGKTTFISLQPWLGMWRMVEVPHCISVS